MKTRASFLPVLAAAGVIAVSGFAGCKSLKPGEKPAKASVKEGTPMMVIAMKAPFYRYGPVQSGGADFLLHKGQRVTLAKREMGFDRVVTADGMSGYVSADQLAPAPVPKPTPTPHVARHSRSHSGSGISAANQKALDGSDAASRYPAENKPQFRY